MGIIIGEFVQEETTCKSNIDDFIEEDAVNEGVLINDQTPEVIKKLGENIKKLFKKTIESICDFFNHLVY